MRWWVLCTVLGLAACSGSSESGQADEPPHVVGFVSDTVKDTAGGVWDTVQAPFEDFGIIEDAIPDTLQKTVNNPYAMPSPLQCDLLRREIAELDAVLGPDVCTALNPTGQVSAGYWQQGAGVARDRAVGFVGGKIGLPFRGVVRRVSGADKHAKALERAYQNGKLRRAFLKGVSVSLLPGCVITPPLSPAPAN